ncbi:MAG: sulfite exporter TauE/SafE family protein [Ilumatobacteraceae bacterium]
MTIGRAFLLFVAGIGGGLTGSIAGLASLVTYPALLAYGLPAVTANVTNTVALVFSSTGSIWGSWPELRDQLPRVVPLSLTGMVGGALGGLLLLHTSADSFEKVVPWLIAIAAAAILLRRRLVVAATEADHLPTVAGHDVGHRAGWGLLVAVGVVGIYGGYFGAGAGVMMLALLLFVTGEPLPSANGVKNAVLGCANGIAAIGFVFFGDVRWAVVAPLGLGLLIGGRVGPIVVRRAPAGPLRIAIAVAGLGLAIKLGIDAYR